MSEDLSDILRYKSKDEIINMIEIYKNRDKFFIYIKKFDYDWIYMKYTIKK